jgi:hypothetical protein
MSDLESIISNPKDVREVKRAVAVKMVEEGLKSANTYKVLKVSVAFVSKRKIIYERIRERNVCGQDIKGVKDISVNLRRMQ